MARAIAASLEESRPASQPMTDGVPADVKGKGKSVVDETGNGTGKNGDGTAHAGNDGGLDMIHALQGDEAMRDAASLLPAEPEAGGTYLHTLCTSFVFFLLVGHGFLEVYRRDS